MTNDERLLLNAAQNIVIAVTDKMHGQRACGSREPNICPYTLIGAEYCRIYVGELSKLTGKTIKEIRDSNILQNITLTKFKCTYQEDREKGKAISEDCWGALILEERELILADLSQE